MVERVVQTAVWTAGFAVYPFLRGGTWYLRDSSVGVVVTAGYAHGVVHGVAHRLLRGHDVPARYSHRLPDEKSKHPD